MREKMKSFIKEVRIPKDAGWLLPGLQVKRWFALILLGAVLITIGMLILLDIKPIYYTMEFIQKLASKVSTEWLAFAFVCLEQHYFLKAGKKQTFLY